MKRSLILSGLLLLLTVPLAASDEPVKGSERSEEVTERGTEQEAPKVGPVLSKQNVSVEGLEAEVINGVMRVRLEGRFQHALVLRVGPDGSRSVECIDEPERLEEILRVEPSDATKPEGGEEN